MKFGFNGVKQAVQEWWWHQTEYFKLEYGNIQNVEMNVVKQGQYLKKLSIDPSHV